MARGRKAELDEVKRAKGNPGRRPLAKPQDGPPPLPPVKDQAPRTLSTEGRKVWGELAPHLARMQFLRATDQAGLARYAENLAGWWKLERKLRREAVVYWTESKHGKIKRINPLFTVQNALEKRLIALEDRLGLSPRARQEILRSLAAQAPQLPGMAVEESPPAEELPPSPLGMLNRGSRALN